MIAARSYRFKPWTRVSKSCTDPWRGGTGPGAAAFHPELGSSSNVVDLAWGPFHREVIAHSVIDITLHEHTQTSEVRQALQVPRNQPDQGTKNTPISLKAMPGIDVDRVTLLSGGQIISRDAARQTLRMHLDADAKNLVLQYDLAVNAGVLQAASIWPGDASQKDAKVRIWSPSGLTASLLDEPAHRSLWKERGIEVVEDRKQFPSLVLQGFRANLPLALEIEEATATPLSALLADRALIEVRMFNDADRSRARYLIRKINAPHVDVELPIPSSLFPEPPTFLLGQRSLRFDKIDANERIVRVKLLPDLNARPAILDISYTLPAGSREGNSFWRTTMYVPVFRGEDVVIGQMRWRLTTPAPMVAASLGRDVRVDTRWSWQNWLPPEASVTSAEMESWLTEQPSQSSLGVTYAFTHVGLQPETVYHLRWQFWLLGCSGLLLVITLGGYFSPFGGRFFGSCFWASHYRVWHSAFSAPRRPGHPVRFRTGNRAHRRLRRHPLGVARTPAPATRLPAGI